MKTLLVTGGRGFIGSHFVELALRAGYRIIDIDKVTYAASEKLPWDDHKSYTHIREDISEIEHLPNCDVLVNFAAESHVDNSIKSSGVFLKSNVLGVHNLLELVRGKAKHDRPLFFQISTDEVYGDRAEGLFTEEDRLAPSNPYSATKASAEFLVKSYGRTYGIDYLITRTSNNYGARQYREKLIPKSIYNLRNDKKIPIHGDGTYVRDWTYVKDNVTALLVLIESGVRNDVYNIAAENFMTNLEVVDTVLKWEDKDRESTQFVENRWGQDLRYAVDSSKVRKLGWKPKHESGLYKWF
jgi:dTDP-glucose 4,6-dehydratase